MRIFILAWALLTSLNVGYGQVYNPSWWSDPTYPVLNGQASNNKAMANLGQLKWMATQAKRHMDAKLIDFGGAGPEITALVAGFSTSGNKTVLNLGQLKAVTKVFYDRLLEVGYDTKRNLIANGYVYNWGSNYPWPQDESLVDKGNFKPATIGQLKLAFAFDLVDVDLDGTLDFLEDYYPAYNPTRDTDNDGIPDITDDNPTVPAAPPTALANYWVSSTPGVASGDPVGSINNPFPSISAAQLALRGLAKTSPVNVNIKPGEYYISSPLVFTSADSGAGGKYIVYRGVDAAGTGAAYGKAKIHAGVLIPNSSWATVLLPNGVTAWRASLDSSSFSGVSMADIAKRTRCIIDGASQKFGWLARTPNQNGYNPRPATVQARIDRGDYKLTVSGDFFNPTSTSPATVTLEYPDNLLGAGYTKAQMNAVVAQWQAALPTSPAAAAAFWTPADTPDNHSEWGLTAYPFSAINTTSQTFTLLPFAQSDGDTSAGISQNSPGNGSRFFVEGFQQCLNSPGEFFIDSAGTYIDYLPISGGVPSYIRIPVSYNLITVQGGAHHIKFVGLEFCDTGLGDARPDSTISAIAIQGSASYIDVQYCNIHHVSGTAISLTDGANNCSITNSYIHDLGVGGIEMYRAKFTPTVPSPNEENPAHWTPSPFCANNVVNFCLITDVGCLYTTSTMSAGVFLGWTQACYVLNTRISGSSRYGISVRGNIYMKRVGGDKVPYKDYSRGVSQNNYVTSVYIDHAGADSADCAALHMAGINDHLNNNGGPFNTFSRMLIEDTFKRQDIPDHLGPWAIYIDHPNGCLNQRFTQIQARDSDNPGASPSVFYHENPNQVEQNVSWQTNRTSAQVQRLNDIAQGLRASVYTGSNYFDPPLQ